MAEYFPFLYAIGSALLVGLALFLLARAGWRKLAITMIVLLALIALMTILRARGMEGMQGLGITVIVVLFLLPGVLGGIIGALVGAWQAKRRGQG